VESELDMVIALNNIEATLRDEKAAQGTKVETRHIHQHGQQSICPCCGGAKVDKNIYGIANSKPCAVCGGTGKQPA
jgi:hypothetical protein